MEPCHAPFLMKSILDQHTLIDFDGLNSWD